jgi:hypothetical protein
MHFYFIYSISYDVNLYLDLWDVNKFVQFNVTQMRDNRNAYMSMTFVGNPEKKRSLGGSRLVYVNIKMAVGVIG